MTSYSLELTSVPTLSKNKPKQAIVLCHGYGGDGKDISVLAYNWQRFLPEAIFLCPNAPEICAVNPKGYQWFDLSSDKKEFAHIISFLMLFNKWFLSLEFHKYIPNGPKLSKQVKEHKKSQ